MNAVEAFSFHKLLKSLQGLSFTECKKLDEALEAFDPTYWNQLPGCLHEVLPYPDLAQIVFGYLDSTLQPATLQQTVLDLIRSARYSYNNTVMLLNGKATIPCPHRTLLATSVASMRAHQWYPKKGSKAIAAIVQPNESLRRKQDPPEEEGNEERKRRRCYYSPRSICMFQIEQFEPSKKADSSSHQSIQTWIRRMYQIAAWRRYQVTFQPYRIHAAIRSLIQTLRGSTWANSLDLRMDMEKKLTWRTSADGPEQTIEFNVSTMFSGDLEWYTHERLASLLTFVLRTHPQASTICVLSPTSTSRHTKRQRLDEDGSYVSMSSTSSSASQLFFPTQVPGSFDRTQMDLTTYLWGILLMDISLHILQCPSPVASQLCPLDQLALPSGWKEKDVQIQSKRLTDWTRGICSGTPVDV